MHVGCSRYGEEEDWAKDALEAQMEKVREGDQTGSLSICLPLVVAERKLLKMKCELANSYSAYPTATAFGKNKSPPRKFIEPMVAGFLTYAALTSVEGLQVSDTDALRATAHATSIAGKYNQFSEEDIRIEVWNSSNK